ncbi:MAG: aldehyde dehydrogenase family protein [Candidatus Electrothrix sp. YB6]
MQLLNKLEPEEREAVESYLKSVRYKQGELIAEKGSSRNGFFILDEGTIRIESIHQAGQPDEWILKYLNAGSTIGEFSLIDDGPRSANYYAHTDVIVRHLSVEDFAALQAQNPKVTSACFAVLSRHLVRLIRRISVESADFQATTTYPPEIEKMVSAGVTAQKSFESWTEERVDALVREIIKCFLEQAESLAEEEVSETGYGVAADKVTKLHFVCSEIARSFLGKKAFGVIRQDEAGGLIEIASPVGVVLGLVPVTNPVPTLLFKTIICIKSRNALIISSHRNALKVGNKAGELIRRILQKHGAPSVLVQWWKERTSRLTTSLLMRHKDVSFILATGGPRMVKAAYSSGTPALGVGSGNAPVMICADADLRNTAQTVVSSKSFDNGVICGSENNLVVASSSKDIFLRFLEKSGAAILTPEEIPLLTACIFDETFQYVQKKIIGKSAENIAYLSGIKRDCKIRLLVVPLKNDQIQEAYGREKLMPVLSLFTFEDENSGFELCKQLLLNEGRGHTAIIHTQNKKLAKRFGLAMPASRILVNTGGSLGCIGASSALSPSMTLGCGTFQGNSTTDNVTYKHLLNIKRIAYPV